MLFDLVKSLTKAEKRHFKLSKSYKEGNTGYMDLFDYLDQASHYKEAEAANHMKEIGYKGNYRAIKDYLYKKLLQTLRTFHTKKFDPTGFYESYRNADLFRRKGLYKHFNKEIRKMEKILAQDRYPNLEILFYAINPPGATIKINADEINGHLDKIDQSDKALKTLLEYNDYRRLMIEVYYKRNLSPMDHEKIPNHDKSILAQDIQYPYFETYILKHTVNYLLSVQNRDIALRNESLKQIVQHYQSNPEQVSNNFWAYLDYNKLYIQSLLVEGKEAAFLEEMEALEQAVKTYHITALREQSFHLCTYYQLKCVHAFFHKKHKDCIQYFETYNEKIEAINGTDQIPPMVLFMSYKYPILSALVSKNYALAAEWCLIAIRLVDKLLKHALIFHIYHLICLYEMGKNKAFGNMVQRKQNFFKQHNLLDPLYTELFNFLKQLTLVKTVVQKESCFKAFQHITDLTDDPVLLDWMKLEEE